MRNKTKVHVITAIVFAIIAVCCFFPMLFGGLMIGVTAVLVYFLVWTIVSAIMDEFR